MLFLILWMSISLLWTMTIGIYGIASVCEIEDVPFYKTIWLLPFLGTKFSDKFNIV